MVEFADILDGIEKSVEPPPRDAGRAYRLFEATFDLNDHAAPEPPKPQPRELPRSGFERLIDAYNQFMKPDPAAAARAEKPVPPPNYAAILADLRRRKRSVEELSALRRSVAWTCHPDRAPDDQRHRAIAFMAEFNAELDAAMARRRKSDNERRAAG